MTPRRPTDARAWAALVSAGLATAVAVWLLPASVHIVGWDGAVARRVALVPPLTRLLLLLGGALVTAGVVGWRAERRHALREVAAAASPLILLALWLVPYLPVVASRAPLLLALAGPLRWLVAALALIGCVAVSLVWRHPESMPRSWPAPGARTVFVVSLVFLVLLGIHVKRVQGLGGDEPHYLIIAHSLLVDGDLRIENNHEARHYQPFHASFMPPHFLRRGRDDVMYSVHAPGLPTLLVPFYAVGGRWGAMVAIALLASLASALIYRLARRLTSGGVALATWAAVTLTVPFALQGWLIFPEIPAAFVMACLAWWLWSPPPTIARAWVWRGALVATLPWLHTKYALLLAGAAICVAIRLWPRLRLMAAWLTPMAASALLWLASFYAMYGTPNPTAPYGPAALADLQLTNVPRGILGLATDQEYGLLTYSPVYLLTLVGAWLMLRRPDGRWPALGLLATAGAFVVSVTQYYMWWGGFSVPARFLVPVLPLLAPLMAVAIDWCRNAAGRGVVATLLLLSIASLAALVADPSAMLMFNDRDGTGRLVELLQGGVHLTAVLPTFLQVDWTSQWARVAIWVLAGAAAAGAAAAVGRRRAVPAPIFWSAAAAVVVFGVTASVAAAMNGLVGDPSATTRLGRQRLMWAYDGDRLPILGLGKAAGLRPADILSHAVLTWTRAVDSPPEGGRIAGPFSLPPGRYEVDVTFDGPSASGDVWAAFHRGPNRLAAVATEGQRAVTLRLTLPIGLDTIWVGSRSEAVARQTKTVEIRPRAVTPVSKRPAVPDITAVDGIDAHRGRYVVYLDRAAYPEGGSWWVGGGQTARALVTMGGATEMHVTVSQGAVAGPVRLQVGDYDETVKLARRQSLERTFDVEPETASMPLAVSCDGWFRPADLNPSSTDTRRLGCYVRVQLR